MDALRYKPAALFRMDDTAPFQDYSGYNRSATLSGTERHGISLTSDTVYSQLVDRTIIATFNTPIYAAGRESQDFSLGATVFPVQRTSGYTAQTYRENLFSNPSAEINTVGIGGASGATVTRGTNRILNGGASFEVASTGANGAGLLLNTNPFIEPGQTYTLSAWVYFTSTIPGISATLRWYNETASTIILDSSFTINAPATGSWLRVSVTATAPPGAFRVSPMIRSYTTHTAMTFYVDSILLEKSSTAGSYFDGGFPGYEWSGTAHNSISRSRTDVSRVNLIRNADFFDGNADGIPDNWAVRAAGNTYTITASPWNVGKKAIKMEVATAGSNLGINNGPFIQVTPGEQLSFTFKYRRLAGTGTLGFGIEWYTNANKTYIVGSYGNTSSFAGDTITFTVAAPAGAGFGSFMVYRDGAANVLGDAFTIAEPVMERGTTVPVNIYAPGDLGVVEAGTAHASESMMLVSNSPIQILSNSGIYDGLTINNNVVSFSTQYVGAGEAKCSYTLDSLRKVDLMGVHTSQKNSLYVDGVLVSEVDLTVAQKTASYVTATQTLLSGLTASSAGLLINNVAMYPRALMSEEVASLTLANNRRASGSVPQMYGGEDVFVGASVRPPAIYAAWTTEADWFAAQLTKTAVDDGALVAQMQDGITLAGTWVDSVDLYSGATPTPLNSVNMFWYGVNETVEASIDGTTWVKVNKGENLSIIPSGFDPTNKALYIRISFPSGVSEAYVDSMVVNGYTSSSVTVNNRLITYTNPAVVFDEQDPVLLRDDCGVRLNGGYVVINPDTTSSTPSTFSTIELWVKVNNASPFYLVDARHTDNTGTYSSVATAGGSLGTTRGTSYINGVASNGPIRIGEWTLIHIVATNPTAAKISINVADWGYQPGQTTADITVGKVALYDTALTAAQIAAITANYTGVNKTTQDGSGSIIMTESPTSTTIYAHDWEIVAS